jgi:hypothetical protein
VTPPYVASADVVHGSGSEHDGRYSLGSSSESSLGWGHVDSAVASRYFEYLTTQDVGFLAEVGAFEVERLRAEPGLVLELLARPEVFEAVFDPQADPLRVSPFLIFAAAVGRAETELRGAAFVPDWFGPRQRVAIFDAPALRELLGDPAVRLFLAELLASYTHVASGSVWVQRRGSWRRQRFSELDPVRLTTLLEVLPEAERPGIYRRLGDLALFLTGVFPDHAATLGLSPVDQVRLRRAAATKPTSGFEPPDGPGLQLWEELGRRWYELAWRTAPVPSAPLEVVARVGKHFPETRRILNFVTDRWLFPLRDRWFPLAGA